MLTQDIQNLYSFIRCRSWSFANAVDIFSIYLCLPSFSVSCVQKLLMGFYRLKEIIDFMNNNNVSVIFVGFQPMTFNFQF